MALSCIVSDIFNVEMSIAAIVLSLISIEKQNVGYISIAYPQSVFEPKSKLS